jgi:tetratricopeptide (TPR) repeat protein
MSTPSPGARGGKLAPGTTIAGRYVVTSHLGSGGMGDVFEVEHNLLGKRFALKRLSGEGASDRGLVERFLREARAAAATGHPGVVDVVDLGFAEDGLPYLVMEKLTGETLRGRLERGPLDEDSLRTLGRAVLGALVACHEAGIIHRDIKPENLFLCSDGRVKVLDFGLSHTAAVDVRLTQSGAVLGTPLYMSPEQARGEDCDVRSDLYSFGAVLYEAATGRPPFTAPAYSVLVAMILEVKPNPERLGKLAEPLKDLILRSLAKSPADRPATAADMLAVVGEGPDERDWGLIATAKTMAPPSYAPTIAAPTPATVADPPPKPAPTRRTGTWHMRYVAPAAAVAVVAAIIVAVVLLAGGGGAKKKAPEAKQAEWQQTFVAGDVEEAAKQARREVMRAPKDQELAGRELLLALCEDRTRAYARARELDGVKLPVFASAAVAATRAVESGQPDLAYDALAAAAASIEPHGTDDLLVRYARADLLLKADRYDRARGELDAILDEWPGFVAALDAMIGTMMFRDEIAEARRRVEALIAAAPPGPNIDQLEIELLLGERRYRDALDRLEDLVAADPGRVDEVYQFRGDLRVLLGDPAGAIAAYDPIDDAPKHDEYVAGALATQGKLGEARQLLVNAMRDYPADRKLSRLGKLMMDASLLALEMNDPELAAKAAAALDGRDQHRLEAPVQSALAFARAVFALLGGPPVDNSAFPLGADSPLLAYLQVRGRDDAASITRIRNTTMPENLHFGVVSTHIYPALWFERARLELVVGSPKTALEWLERVLRPRHYDASRGMFVLRALELQATALDQLGRTGEGDAVRREISQLRGAQR